MTDPRPVDHLLLEQIIGLRSDLQQQRRQPESVRYWERSRVIARPQQSPASSALELQFPTIPAGVGELELIAWQAGVGFQNLAAAAATTESPLIILRGKEAGNNPAVSTYGHTLGQAPSVIPQALITVPPTGELVRRHVQAADVEWVTLWWPLNETTVNPHYAQLIIRGRWIGET